MSLFLVAYATYRTFCKNVYRMLLRSKGIYRIFAKRKYIEPSIARYIDPKSVDIRLTAIDIWTLLPQPQSIFYLIVNRYISFGNEFIPCRLCDISNVLQERISNAFAKQRHISNEFAPATFIYRIRPKGEYIDYQSVDIRLTAIDILPNGKSIYRLRRFDIFPSEMRSYLSSLMRHIERSARTYIECFCEAKAYIE